MKIAYFIGIFLTLASSAHAASWPKEQDQERVETKGPAYNKALMKATREPKQALCYYQTDGCDAKTEAENNSMPAVERPAKDYPQQGYLLESDGKYHFRSNAFSRN